MGPTCLWSTRRLSCRENCWASRTPDTLDWLGLEGASGAVGHPCVPAIRFPVPCEHLVCFEGNVVLNVPLPSLRAGERSLACFKDGGELRVSAGAVGLRENETWRRPLSCVLRDQSGRDRQKAGGGAPASPEGMLPWGR